MCYGSLALGCVGRRKDDDLFHRPKWEEETFRNTAKEEILSRSSLVEKSRQPRREISHVMTLTWKATDNGIGAGDVLKRWISTHHKRFWRGALAKQVWKQS